MSIKVSEVSGGPYSHEVDAIRDERYRAKVMGVEPDFETLFANVEFISPGAARVIKDIDKPIELPVGEFIENVVFHGEEETPEAPAEEAEPSFNPNYSENSAPEEAGTEPGTSTDGMESAPVDEALVELEELIDSPIFDEMGATNV